eukprot:scaffold31205_cov38-Attheya_sp.AAC.1
MEGLESRYYLSKSAPCPCVGYGRHDLSARAACYRPPFRLTDSSYLPYVCILVPSREREAK